MENFTWLPYPDNAPEQDGWYLTVCEDGSVHPAHYMPDHSWFAIGTTSKVIAFIAPPPYVKAQPQLPLDTGGER